MIGHRPSFTETCNETFIETFNETSRGPPVLRTAILRIAGNQVLGCFSIFPGRFGVREYFQWLRIEIPCNLAVVARPELSYEPDSGSEQLHKFLMSFCNSFLQKLLSDGRLTPHTPSMADPHRNSTQIYGVTLPGEFSKFHLVKSLQLQQKT